MSSSLTAERNFGIKIAKEAGAIIKENFISGLSFEMKKALKSDMTIVTKTDTEINDYVIKSVKREFPQHNIIGEEKSDLSKKSEYAWVCDPVDGTFAFAHGIPNCVFSLALTKNGIPITGVVYDPFFDRMFSAEIGHGAFLNATKIKVSTRSTLKGSAVGVAYWSSPQFNLEPLYSKLIQEGASVLQLGSIAYMGALVSNGSFVASVHPARFAYDSAALKVIIEEANGRVTDLFGQEQRYDGTIRGCIMSNSFLHEELVRLFTQ